MLKYLNNPVTKKVLSVTTAVLMGIGTVVSTIADQKKAMEFEDMKKTLAELKKGMGES